MDLFAFNERRRYAEAEMNRSAQDLLALLAPWKAEVFYHPPHPSGEPACLVVRTGRRGGPWLAVELDDESALNPDDAIRQATRVVHRWWTNLKPIEREPNLVLGEN